MPQVFIGCSGYSYKHWRGNFYPEELSQKKWFEQYSSIFSTVELNVTFYRTPAPESFKHWLESSPPHFTFAVKGSRYLTHIKKLLEPEIPLERFFSPARELQNKLKVVLWQLAPSFKVDLPRLYPFLEGIREYPVRHTVEVRNESWLVPEVIDLFARYGVSFCKADWPPFLEDAPDTADFVYLRRHGYRGTYNGSYTSEELTHDAERIAKHIKGGRDVFIYFNNDIGGAAPRNAQELRSILRERDIKAL